MTPNETAFREASGAVTATHFPPPRLRGSVLIGRRPKGAAPDGTPSLASSARRPAGDRQVVGPTTAKNQGENIMADKQVAAPDNTAVRVALWRALHVEVDSPPHVLEDKVGLKLAAPD